MNKTVLKTTSAGAALVGWMVLSAFSPAAKSIEIGVPATSAAAWEIAAMEAAGVADHHGIKIDIVDLPDAAAGQSALVEGDVDAILTDFAWTSAQRQGGADYTFVPQAYASGALMVAQDSPIQSAADLGGAAVGIAGTSGDIAFAVLATYMASSGGAVDARFDAPAAVSAMLQSGEVAAAFGPGDFAALAAAGGAVELVPMTDMLADLGVEGAPPMVGWVFSERWARSHRDEIARFLDAAFETRQRLLEDDALWEEIRPDIGAELSDEAFAALRDSYRRTAVISYDEGDAAAAAALLALIAGQGAAGLTAEAGVMAEGTFWGGYRVGG